MRGHMLFPLLPEPESMSVTAAASHYDITKDPFFWALNQGSAPAKGAVPPPAGYKTYAQQDAQLKVNVDNFLIGYTYQSFASGPAVQANPYPAGSNGALVQSIFQFGNDLSTAAGQLAALGSQVNTHA